MSKPALTYQQQLDLLKQRGLTVHDEPAALHYLAHHNYYRLSAYRFSFSERTDPDTFVPGTTFDQLVDLYQFDRKLRQLVLEACEVFEISARSRWAFEFGHTLGPVEYTNNQHFKNPQFHARTLTRLDEEMSRSKEDFVRHHRRTLQMQWPPSWVVAEVASFGNTSNLISQLKAPAIRQAIANTYDLDEVTLCSILHHLSVVRNTAAHHSRLWNRKFTVIPKIPTRKPPHLLPNFVISTNNHPQKKLYNTLVLLIHLCSKMAPDSDWENRLIDLLQTLDPNLIGEMGFPTDWKIRPIWKDLLAANP